MNGADVTLSVTLPAEAVEIFARAVADLVTAQASTESARYLSAREAAAYLGVSENHVRNLVASNEIPHKRIGRSVRFRPSEIDAWLDSRR